MLQDTEIAAMRATAAGSLPGTAVINSGTLVSDGGGGYAESFGAGGTVPCRIAPANAGEGEVGGRISSDAEWIITLPAETSVDTDDQIVSGGKTFTVVAIRGPRSYEVTRRVEARSLT